MVGIERISFPASSSADGLGNQPKRYLQFLHKSQSPVPYCDESRTGSGNGALDRIYPVQDVNSTICWSRPRRCPEATLPERRTSGSAAIRWAVHASPFGDCLLGLYLSPRGDLPLGFCIDEKALHGGRIGFARRIGLGPIWSHDPRIRCVNEIDQRLFLSSIISGVALSVLLKGTNFQIKVMGQRYYEYRHRPCQVATDSSPKAVDSLSSLSRSWLDAIGANSIAYLIPCHRVIRSNGEFGGYRTGGALSETTECSHGQVNSLRQFIDWIANLIALQVLWIRTNRIGNNPRCLSHR